MSGGNNFGLVTKVWFPREILPLSSLLAALVDFLIAGLLLIGLMIFYGTSVTQNIFWLLFLIPLQMIITAGINFLLAASVVIFRDLKFVIPLEIGRAHV